MPTTDLERTSLELVLPIQDAVFLARAGLGAVSKDDVTPIITGVLLTVANEEATVLSTDRYRVHRATRVVPEAAELPPMLLPARALRWLVANAGFFGRASRLLVDPVVTFTFYPKPLEDPSKGSLPCPEGWVTIMIAEHRNEGASELSLSSKLIKGNYPPVGRLIDEALAKKGEPADGRFDMAHVTNVACLVEDRSERPEIRFVGASEKKPGQALFLFRSAVGLIQMAQYER